MRVATSVQPPVPDPAPAPTAAPGRQARLRLGALSGAVAIAISLAVAGGVADPAAAGSGASGPGTPAHAVSAHTPSAHAVFGSNWPVYHLDGLGDGNDPTGTDLSPATAAWTSPPVDGQVFGEPLVVGGRVVVATENDSVYELAANTGAVIWSTHIDSPVPAGDLACGDISPTVGITGTPVIDAGRGEVFVVTDESVGGSGAQHYLVGLDLYTGVVLLHQPISLPGSSQLDQLQRPGLALDAGNVIATFGGNAGDCGNYHGWVVAIPEGGGGQQSFEVASAPGDHEGAIWMGGAAPLVDGQGNIWLATGNSAITTTGQPYDNGDGVLELSLSLHLVQFFAPSTWPSDNATDFDLGSSAPALIGNGLAFQ
ncbi:MAG TPA: PQQ-binding-like beta-propeller repeat protein, partial [Acidimicrobiales bacterium]|nr:PQQ-binding-like beta-propeller repeat protein [Acidimicrobiales bacterium]